MSEKLKKINEQKLQAFAIGAMGKRVLSRKEQEEQRKKEEEEAAAHAFKEFVETFQEAPSSISKVWVKAGTYDAGSRREDHREKGKLYKPTSKIEERTTAEKAQEYARMLASDSKRDAALLKKKNHEKKKSNLELFKEELRQIQEEREERHKYKHMARTMLHQTPEPDPVAKETEVGSFDNGDPNTTNLYLGNLSPKISEQQLMELFGRFGPLASIKIMWPRSEEEKSRGRNCGFVAYMSRRDAERALRGLNGKDVMGYEMKLGWGKSVPILTHPIYIPPALVEFAMPPPPSGLPFNAQPSPYDVQVVPELNVNDYLKDPEMSEKIDKVLFKAVVKVVIPTERTLLGIIHRMAEFVIREGPMFEAMIMNREIENPTFRFLFENESPAHIYYRWKLFSLLQGDTPTEWRQTEFRMFEGGSIWKPPAANFYTQGMPDELIQDEETNDVNKGALSTAQRDRLEDLIRHLTPERAKIGDVMIFCIEHADAADEICECIAESLANPDTLAHKKIARLYLISDILHNCSVKVSNASFFRKAMERNLIDIFKDLHTSYMSLESRLKAEGFKVRVLGVWKAWEEWTVYPRDFLIRLKNIFLGLPSPPPPEEDFDGAPLSGDEKEDEDLDGVPLDGAALLKGALLRGIPDAKPPALIKRENDNSQEMTSSEAEDDIDGIPLDDDIDGIPFDKFSRKPQAGAFVPSKWETVDPEQVEAQAVTTSKWDTLDPIAPEPPHISRDSDTDNDDDNDDDEDSFDETHDYVEARRIRLREVELKLMEYQDELESGKRAVKPGWSFAQQLEHYRRKLLKKTDKDLRQDNSDSDKYSPTSGKGSRRRSTSPSDISKKSKKKNRSPSPQLPYTRQKSKRARSRSSSSSPKRYIKDRSPQAATQSQQLHLLHRSPSPKSSRYMSPSGARNRRSPVSKILRDPQAGGHRIDKHKHKHKY